MIMKKVIFNFHSYLEANYLNKERLYLNFCAIAIIGATSFAAFTTS